MEERQNMLTEMYADLRGMRGELMEFKRDSLRRLDLLEKEMKDAPAKWISIAAATVSIAGSILACINCIAVARG